MKKLNFVVDFFEVNKGITTRRKIQGSPILHTNNAPSDFAVYAYVKRLYPDSEVIINTIDWK
jgi:hypothetical protein